MTSAIAKSSFCSRKLCPICRRVVNVYFSKPVWRGLVFFIHIRLRFPIKLGRPLVSERPSASLRNHVLKINGPSSSSGSWMPSTVTFQRHSQRGLLFRSRTNFRSRITEFRSRERRQWVGVTSNTVHSCSEIILYVDFSNERNENNCFFSCFLLLSLPPFWV